jgi:hypothetical protein
MLQHSQKFKKHHLKHNDKQKTKTTMTVTKKRHPSFYNLLYL